MVDLLKFYTNNVKKEEYYYEFYDELINCTKMEDSSRDTKKFIFLDDNNIIEKFKELCQPETEIDNAYNKRLFYFICFYLFKNGYILKEFPRLFEIPPYEPKDFTSLEIKSRLISLGRQRSNGIVPYVEIRKLIADFTIEKSSSIDIEIKEDIDTMFEKISTRSASFASMADDEKLKEIANIIEFMLLEDGKFKKLDYSTIAFEYITDDLVKNFRKKLQCFRHSSSEALEERKTLTDEQKSFMIDYGITIVKVIHNLIK